MTPFVVFFWARSKSSNAACPDQQWTMHSHFKFFFFLSVEIYVEKVNHILQVTIFQFPIRRIRLKFPTRQRPFSQKQAERAKQTNPAQVHLKGTGRVESSSAKFWHRHFRLQNKSHKVRWGWNACVSTLWNCGSGGCPDPFSVEESEFVQNDGALLRKGYTKPKSKDLSIYKSWPGEVGTRGSTDASQNKIQGCPHVFYNP